MADVVPGGAGEPDGELIDRLTIERLSPVAVRLVDAITSAWGLTPVDACALMGNIPHATWVGWVRHPDTALLTGEGLSRASCIAGIYRALHALYSAPLAEQWMTIRNSGSVYSGHTPLEFVTGSGIEGLRIVREHLDGLLHAQ